MPLQIVQGDDSEWNCSSAVSISVEYRLFQDSTYVFKDELLRISYDIPNDINALAFTSLLARRFIDLTREYNLFPLWVSSFQVQVKSGRQWVTIESFALDNDLNGIQFSIRPLGIDKVLYKDFVVQQLRIQNPHLSGRDEHWSEWVDKYINGKCLTSGIPRGLNKNFTDGRLFGDDQKIALVDAQFFESRGSKCFYKKSFLFQFNERLILTQEHFTSFTTNYQVAYEKQFKETFNASVSILAPKSSKENSEFQHIPMTKFEEGYDVTKLLKEEDGLQYKLIIRVEPLEKQKSVQQLIENYPLFIPTPAIDPKNNPTYFDSFVLNSSNNLFFIDFGRVPRDEKHLYEITRKQKKSYMGCFNSFSQ
ncbi:hypothetical protein GEMRC1_000567 [Eukaryota sp. GEM-RC1]